MLIDLSPPQQIEPNFPSTSNTNGAISGVSILDAPIEIPTQNDSSDLTTDLNSTDMFSSLETNRLEPPPYQSPPTYMNTYGLCQYHSTATIMNPTDLVGVNFSSIDKPTTSAFDPFDTSHIASSKSYSSTVNVMLDNLKKDNKNNVNKNQENTIRNRPNYASQLDELVQNTMVSLSPKSSHSSLTNTSEGSSRLTNQNLNNQLNYGADKLMNATEDNALSDSMQVNLSSLTLNDTAEDLSSSNLVAANGNKENDTDSALVKKFDKSFLAELEKEMYKKETTATNINMNSSQSYASQSTNKENTVNAIPSDIYGRSGTFSNINTRLYNDAMVPSSLTSTPSTSIPPPGKLTNAYTKSTNQDIASGKSNYDSSSATNSSTRNYYTASPNHSPIILNKKQQNTEQMTNGSKSAAATNLNQMWVDRQTTIPSSSSIPNPVYTNEQAVYSNYSATHLYGNATTLSSEQKHHYVAVANRPPGKNQQPRTNSNLYNSVTSDIYGSGNIYDVVALPNSTSAASNYYDIFASNATNTTTTSTAITNTNKIDNYYEAITTNESQSVIYDEVAGEEMLRPHRPAPIAPPTLSAQQIQRRLERAQKEQMYGNVGLSTNGNVSTIYGNSNDLNSQQKIMALMKEISCDGCADATEQEVASALQIANWDHGTAVHQFKIDRLHK